MGRLIVISGPSCVGKTPLYAALRRLYPDLAGDVRPVVLYNSRAPRPAERDGVDYHFRPRDAIEDLRRRDDVTVMVVRGDLQAVDLSELAQNLAETDMLYEGNPFVGHALLTSRLAADFPTISVFISPVSKEEIAYLQSPVCLASVPDVVTDVMRRKLLRRTTRHKGRLGLPDLQNVERRAQSAWRELKLAARFDWVIPNHDGEDSENWDAFYYPLGDARKALISVVQLLRGETPEHAERWQENLIG